MLKSEEKEVEKQNEAESWTGIQRVWMSPDVGFVIGLREDGTLVAAGLELEELYSAGFCNKS